MFLAGFYYLPKRFIAILLGLKLDETDLSMKLILPGSLSLSICPRVKPLIDVGVLESICIEPPVNRTSCFQCLGCIGAEQSASIIGINAWMSRIDCLRPCHTSHSDASSGSI
jgi:hypothetical protein